MAETRSAKIVVDEEGPPDSVARVLHSGLFDAGFYRNHHSLSFVEEEEGGRHYVEVGCGFSWKPNLYFDPVYYLQRVGDVSLPVSDALRHFLDRGDAAGIRPGVLFDNQWYRDRYRIPTDANTLAHYLRHRRSGLYSPLPQFDVAFYLEKNPDVKAAGIDPFEHFLLTGYREGRNPSSDFDVAYYSEVYFGVQLFEAKINPLLYHLEQHAATPIKAKAVRRGEEFLLAGHSNYFAMGAPGKYRGPLGLVAGEAHGRSGFYVMEENSADRTQAYWDLVAESSNSRDVVLSWSGNQHFAYFLFEPAPYFDFIEPSVPHGAELREGAVIVPRRLIKGFFQPSFGPLATVLQRVRQNGARSITVVGTPPPRRDLVVFEKLIRPSPFWRGVAAGCGLDLDTARLVPAQLLLKLWAVLQEMLGEAAAQASSRFVPVPDFLHDPEGYLPGMYGIDTDFTHANEAYGRQMMKLALS